MKGIPFVINFTDASLPGKKRFVILPKTSDGRNPPNSLRLDPYATEQHTSLILPGHGLPEYALRINHDLMWMLEHYASRVPVTNPTIGQIWYDTGAGIVRVWDGDQWTGIGGDKTIATINDHNKLVELINVAISSPAIEDPYNITPSNGATQVAPMVTLVGSTYKSRFNAAQVLAQFQISLTPGFEAPSIDFTSYGTTSTYRHDQNLPSNTVFYWRFRFRDDQGEFSKWSVGTQFRTALATINMPVIIAPPGNTTIPLTPLLQSSQISVFNGNDTLASCEWEIWNSPNASGVRVMIANSAGYAYQVPAGTLAYGASYYVRVRHIGATLAPSPWSAEVKYDTPAPFLDTPYVASPASGGTVSVNPTLIGSEMTVTGGTDTLQVASWEIWTGPDLSGSRIYAADIALSRQLTIPANTLAYGTSYYARVRYTGSRYGVSPWSAISLFRTEFIPAGTVLGYYCAGFTRVAVTANGSGGTYDQVVGENSPECGYVPPSYPAAGTVLSTFCQGVDKYNSVADGNGGANNVLVEVNSVSCGWTRPPTLFINSGMWTSPINGTIYVSGVGRGGNGGYGFGLWGGHNDSAAGGGGGGSGGYISRFPINVTVGQQIQIDFSSTSVRVGAYIALNSGTNGKDAYRYDGGTGGTTNGVVTGGVGGHTLGARVGSGVPGGPGATLNVPQHNGAGGQGGLVNNTGLGGKGYGAGGGGTPGAMGNRTRDGGGGGGGGGGYIPTGADGNLQLAIGTTGSSGCIEIEYK